MSDTKQKQVRMNFRMTKALTDELRKMAKARGEPLSVVIRDSIRKEISVFNQFRG